MRHAVKSSQSLTWTLLAAVMFAFACAGSYMLITSHAANFVGDINGDGKVDAADLSFLLSSYGNLVPACKTNANFTCDLNGDHKVDISDLSILLTNFGNTNPPPSNFIAVCGAQLCLNGAGFRIHGATAYHEYDASRIPNEIQHAKSLRLNVLEMSVYDNLAEVDNYVAAAKQAGLHIIINLSVFGQQHGNSLDFATWQPYFDTIASKYGNEPTVAMIEIFGEPPNSTAAKGFFATSLDYLVNTKHVHNIVSSGGIGYIDFSGPLQQAWHAIMQDPNNQTCDVEVNSSAEETYSAPAVEDYCTNTLHKPWFLSAWSSCMGTGDYNHRGSAAAVGQHAQAMYTLSKTGNGAGTDFWNLSTDSSEDCSPNDPSLPFWQTVLKNAP